MRRLLEAIAKTDPNRNNRVVTMLDGASAGDRALFSDGRLVWENRPGGWFAAHTEVGGRDAACGVFQENGQRIFCDVLGQERRLVICGGGHVSIPVIRIGVMMGWQVTVLEDRPLFADHARRAGAQEVLWMPFEEGLEQVKGSTDTYFVILTRGHRYDQVCLENILDKEHAYIGMIGSRRRSALVKQSLAEKGFGKALLDQVASPIGLDIGAETPEEIGVAIAAELIEVKSRKRQTCGYPKDIVEALSAEEAQPREKVLATIVDRKGSAPRGIGTKMLVLEDGTLVGTIGGGCVEAKVQWAALGMMHRPEKWKLIKADMTGEDAEEEGMVCGGQIEVLMEVCES